MKKKGYSFVFSFDMLLLWSASVFYCIIHGGMAAERVYLLFNFQKGVMLDDNPAIGSLRNGLS